MKFEVALAQGGEGEAHHYVDREEGVHIHQAATVKRTLKGGIQERETRTREWDRNQIFKKIKNILR